MDSKPTHKTDSKPTLKGQPFRFWGLGQGKLGFRGGTLGFGGWDMATWGLGVGLGDNPVGFGAIILRWSWVGGQLGKFKEHHHPPPTPHHQLRSISHVCKFHERHHPPKTTHGSGPRPTGQERAGSPQGQERGNFGGQDRAPFHFECIYIFLYSVNIVQYVLYIHYLFISTPNGNSHHTCKNCPMQAKVLIKSHRYLGTSWLTSSRAVSFWSAS